MKATHVDSHDSDKPGHACPKRTGIVLSVLLLCAPGALAIAATREAQEARETQTLQLGARTFAITKTTPNGTPVIPMWKAQMPTGNQAKAVGFPMLRDARHFDVWKPADKREGAFNHHPALGFHDGRLYAMWANHWYGEDGPGQRILYSTSRDGREWSPPAELFAPPGPIQTKEKKGINLRPERWVVVDGKLHAVIYAHGAGMYPIAREVAGDGTLLGEPFLLRDLPKNAALPEFMPGPRKDPMLAEKINKWYKDNDTVNWWAHLAREIRSRAVDGARLIEPFVFRSKDGLVLCMRDFSSSHPSAETKSTNRIYASFGDGKGGWSPFYPTDIPDSHSRAQALRLPDGRVLLVGNQIASQFDQALSLVRDPLTLAVSPDGEFFTKVFALRSGGRVRPSHRFTGIVNSRPAGYGYPSMLVHDGMIYVLYSINKEDIAISMAPLDALNASEK